MSSPTAEKLLETTNAFLNAFGSLDPEALSATQANNYTHVFAPASLGSGEPFTRQSLGEYLVKLQGILECFRLDFKRILPNPHLRQSVVWAGSETIFLEHVKDGDRAEWKFEGEHIFILSMDEAGEKVVDIVEFLDSKKSEILYGLISRAFQTKEALEAGTSNTESYNGSCSQDGRRDFTSMIANLVWANIVTNIIHLNMLRPEYRS
ncbi:hypothetical protein BJY01DRAFT_255087 [Aspergillus pseudoustus]|uniref:SnoaL-like domain-containing protein n=1 Tax=Aspergillus pseudoustus TaxID=1810923 RepID=A0ABR4INF9_9EURO